MKYLKNWDDIPEFMRNSEVNLYFDKLNDKRVQLFVKRAFDVCVSLLLIGILALPMLFICIWIRYDSPGSAIFRQERVTQYGKHFYIHKFRTMTISYNPKDSLITVDGNARITNAGKLLRDKRIDELPQLFDILVGNMSFVGTRPEVPRYVDQYTDEMLATLLLPAGVTSEVSILFKDEAKLLVGSNNIDRDYVEKVLPEKMRYNLAGIKNFSIGNEILVLIRTLMI